MPASQIDHLRTPESRMRACAFGLKHYYNIRNRLVVVRRYARFRFLAGSIAMGYALAVWGIACKVSWIASLRLLCGAVLDGWSGRLDVLGRVLCADAQGADGVTVSLVSHGQGALAMKALQSLATSLRGYSGSVRVVVTLNIPDPECQEKLRTTPWPFDLSVICNQHAMGFGANHNQAFHREQVAHRSIWFVVMNPDIVWPSEPMDFWHKLLRHADSPRVGLLCPVQLDVQGHQQDFARHLMTPWGLVRRGWRRWRGLPPTGVAARVEEADWVNAACMVLRPQAFFEVGGFDERYFMYCEDTDLCLRLQLAGWRLQSSDVRVTHDAQRHSHRQRRQFCWHVNSLLRFWSSATFWRYVVWSFRDK